MTIHQLLFSSYAPGWASLESRAQCSKSGKETLKISAGIWMFGQTKGWISVFKFCQPKLRHLFRRTNYCSEDMHFHRQPSSGRSLQESYGDPLGLQHLCLGTSLYVPEPLSQHSWSHREVGLPSLQTRKRNSWTHSRKLSLSWDRQICSCLSSHSMDLTITQSSPHPVL